MSRIKLVTTFSPIININNVEGSLRIKGWDRPEFRGDADQNDTMDVNQEGNIINVSCRSGCMLRVPLESKINIGAVGRELMIKSIEGEIKIGEVTQQVVIKNTSTITIQTANSNLNAKQIEGDLHINTVQGNAVIRDIEGKLSITNSLGNFNFRGLSMGFMANVKGNAFLRFEPEPGGKYEVTAEGNINCKVTPDTGGKVSIKSKDKSIRVKTPQISEQINREEFNFSFGGEESEIILNAQNNVSFVTSQSGDVLGEDFDLPMEEDFTNFADEITQHVTNQIDSQMAALSTHLNEITAGLSVGAASSERSRHKLEAKRRSLERQLSKTQTKVDRKKRAMEAKKRAYQHRQHREKPSDPVSDEERKMILDMLQSQQISVEEAELLLAALEGEGPKNMQSTSPSEVPAPSETPGSAKKTGTAKPKAKSMTKRASAKTRKPKSGPSNKEK